MCFVYDRRTHGDKDIQRRGDRYPRRGAEWSPQRGIIPLESRRTGENHLGKRRMFRMEATSTCSLHRPLGGDHCPNSPGVQDPPPHFSGGSMAPSRLGGRKGLPGTWPTRHSAAPVSQAALGFQGTTSALSSKSPS